MEIAVIGAGTIGHSWALLFSWKGYKVRLYDIKEQILMLALEKIKNEIRQLTLSNVIKDDQIEKIINNIELTSDLRRAVDNCDYIQESAPELVELKRKLFHEIELFANENSIIASSSSSIPISALQKDMRKPERAIVVHPINPPHLIPVVEIVPSQITSKETIQKTIEIMKNLGKEPVIIKKEIKGFIVNRLSAAIFHEMVWLLNNDIASVEDIDKCIRDGLGLRWALMGQFEIWHIGGGKEGIREFYEKLGKMIEEVYEDLNKSSPYFLLPDIKERTIKEIESSYPTINFPERIRWRDEMLLKLLKLKGYI